MGRCVASVVIASSSVGIGGACMARTLGEGERVVVEGDVDPVDRWNLRERSQLYLLRGAVSREIVGFGGTVVMRDASVASSQYGIISSRGVLDIEDSSVDGGPGVGIRLEGRSIDMASQVSMARSSVRGDAAGMTVDARSLVRAAATSISSVEPGGLGILLAWGDVTLTDKSVVRGDASGVFMGTAHRLSDGGPTNLLVSGSTVQAIHGAAIQVGGNAFGESTAHVTLEQGSMINSEHGPAVAVAEGGRLDLRAKNSEIVGDVRVSPGATAAIRLDSGSLLRGDVTGDTVVSVGRAAQWSVSRDSHASQLFFEGGTIAFDERLSPGALRVSGGIEGSGGEVRLRVDASSLDPRSASARDRLLVDGDVNTASPISVIPILSGTPGTTDVNANQVADNNEGVSLVQVGGQAARDSFRLNGTYAVLGAYQYELKAFGPDEVDIAQSELSDGKLNWDYRLVSRQVAKEGGKEEAPKETRPAVAPQIASYISAPGAVFAYADGIATSLHERLGEIRDHAFEGSIGTEIFARYSGRNERYSSGRSFNDYGYDFDGTTEAWQFGGSLIGLDGDNGSLRAGWAIDRGRASVTPRAVDGESVTRLRANGTSAWLTWRSGNGFWMDWVVGHQRMRGQTDTALSGRNVGKLRGSSTGISLGAGLPFQLGDAWSLEPHVALSTQSVRIDPIKEEGGLDVRFRGRRYVTRMAGISVSHQGPMITPFVRFDLRSTSGSAVVVTGTKDAMSTSRFAAGRAGEEFLVSGGLTAQLTPRLQAFGEGSYRHYVGAGGFQGWSGNMGLRLTF